MKFSLSMFPMGCSKNVRCVVMIISASVVNVAAKMVGMSPFSFFCVLEVHVHSFLVLLSLDYSTKDKNR